jgi:hypothetical protein
MPAAAPGRREEAPIPPCFDVTADTLEQVAMVRQFLARLETMEPAAGHRLAHQLSESMRPRVYAAGARLSDIGLLRTIVAAKDVFGSR